MYRTLVVITVFVLLATDSCSGQCDQGYWGEGCKNYCGYCSPGLAGTQQSSTNLNPYDRNCSSVDGRCSYNCQDGWSGIRCDKPICTRGCGPGECLAPNYCGKCGSISLISPNCEDIRLRGLIGAAIAIGILTLSLALLRIGSDTNFVVQ